jgi:hypothetical protein
MIVRNVEKRRCDPKSRKSRFGSILDPMRSEIAQQFAREDQARDLSLTIEERFVLIRRLGERDLQAFMSANTLERDEAIRQIEHARQRGRRVSGAMERVIDVSRSGGPPDA